jgi:hypothetical protein
MVLRRLLPAALAVASLQDAMVRVLTKQIIMLVKDPYE